MDKIKKYKFIAAIIVITTLAIAPLTGCKIIKLPYTIAKSVATDVGDAVGLVDKEEVPNKEPEKTSEKTPPNDNEPQAGSSLGGFYTIWVVVLMFGVLAIFIRKNKDRKNGHLRPLDPRDAAK